MQCGIVACQPAQERARESWPGLQWEEAGPGRQAEESPRQRCKGTYYYHPARFIVDIGIINQ